MLKCWSLDFFFFKKTTVFLTCLILNQGGLGGGEDTIFRNILRVEIFLNAYDQCMMEIAMTRK